jgi:hypothetical protein
MANREVRFRKSEIKRAMDGVKLAGYEIGSVNVAPDGTLIIIPRASEPEAKDERPNSFDQVLGGSA